MSGLFVGDWSHYIESVEKRSTRVSLLAKGDGCEVMLQTIAPGSRITLTPGPNPEAFEFYLIMSGYLVWERSEGESSLLGSGYHIWIHSLDEPAYFKAQTEVKLLYVSSRPVFHSLSDKIQKLVALAQKVEAKDGPTERHCERIQQLCTKVGEKLKLSPARLEQLIYAAFLHDIGKVEVPDHILLKNGPLNEEEWAVVIQHPAVGCEMIQDSYLKLAAKIVEQHHERIDGSGYPKGLKGGEILLEAQIVAVVDAYDAMTSDRPYRKAMSHSDAVAELYANCGTQFRRDVVDALVEVVTSDLPTEETLPVL